MTFPLSLSLEKTMLQSTFFKLTNDMRNRNRTNERVQYGTGV